MFHWLIRFAYALLTFFLPKHTGESAPGYSEHNALQFARHMYVRVIDEELCEQTGVYTLRIEVGNFANVKIHPSFLNNFFVSKGKIYMKDYIDGGETVVMFISTDLAAEHLALSYIDKTELRLDLVPELKEGVLYYIPQETPYIQ